MPGPLALGAAGILAYLVVVEGGLSLWDYLEGNPEADVQEALQAVAAQNQMMARTQLAAEQRGRERVGAQFSKFNPLAMDALTTTGQLGRQDVMAQMRGPAGGAQGEFMGGGRELLDYVATKVGMRPEDLSKRTAPGRMGDMTGIVRAAGGPIPK